MAEATSTIVTARADMATDHQLSKVAVVLMAPVKIVFVRALRVYLQTLIGLLGAFGLGAASEVGVTMTAGTFAHTLLACASLALAPAIMSVLQNTVELLAQVDARLPKVRA
jgi:hypothetical protein